MVPMKDVPIKTINGSHATREMAQYAADASERAGKLQDLTAHYHMTPNYTPPKPGPRP